MSDLNAYNFFIESCNLNNNNENNVMMICHDKKITYAEFDKKVKIDYRAFFDEIKDCSRAGIILPDSITQMIIYWGLLRINITPALFSYNESLESIIDTVNAADIDVLVVNSSLPPNIDSIIKNCRLKRIYIANNEEYLELYYLNLEKTIKKKEGKFILFSSGTTGISKGIIHKQSDMKHAAEAYGKQILKLTNKDILYSMANLNYGFAFTNSTFQSCYAGATSIIDNKTDIWTIAENINKFKPTVICGVPAIYKMLIQISEISEINFNSVRLALSSGEKLPKNLWDLWYNKFNIPIIEGYGSVEMLTNVISNSIDNYVVGSSGKLLDGFDCTLDKFDDENDNSGILKITGNSISNTTIKSDENESKTYNTNDIFTIDDNGYFWYNGRAGNIYKVNGVWFNPFSIEALLEAEHDIKEAFIINENMKLIAFIVKNDNSLFDVSYFRELNKKLKQSNNHSICPDKYIVVSKIPRNKNGKKKRIVIEEPLWNDVYEV